MPTPFPKHPTADTTISDKSLVNFKLVIYQTPLYWVRFPPLSQANLSGIIAWFLLKHENVFWYSGCPVKAVPQHATWKYKKSPECAKRTKQRSAKSNDSAHASITRRYFKTETAASRLIFHPYVQIKSTCGFAIAYC